MARRASTAKPSKGISLQQRDLQIMEALVQLRAETLDELHAEYFPGLSRKRAVNRLAQLARGGFLQPADVTLFGEDQPTRVYTLGRKARAALEMRSLSSEHFRFRRWNPTLRDTSIPHQIVVNRLGRELGVTLLPEHLLPVPDKNGARNRPDAVVEGVDKSDERVLLGIEVDLGHYSRERILAKHAAWREQPDHGTLLFVVPDDERKEKLSRWLERTHNTTAVLTREEFSEAIEFSRTSGDGLFFSMDIWTGGNAWDKQREFDRQWEQEQLEYERRQQAEHQAQLQSQAVAAERARQDAAARAARPISRRRRRA